MEKRLNRVKVFFSNEDITKVRLFIAVNNLNTNVSVMARLVLRKKLETREINLPYIETRETRNVEMLILFSDNEKHLIHELSEHNKISNSEVVRILVLTFLGEFMKRDKVDIDNLKQLYYEKKLSLKEVSKELEISQSLVLRLMEKHELPRREAKQNVDMNEKINIKTLKKLYYNEKLGIRKIANLFKVSDSSILKFMIENKLDRRPQKAIICDLAIS